MIVTKTTAATTVLALVNLACGSTQFVSTWKEPSAEKASLVGQKVAMFNLVPQESIRRSTEDLLASEIGARGVSTVSGYTLLPGEQARDTEKARQVLGEDDCDYVLVLRAVNTDHDISYMHERTWWHSPIVSGPYRPWDSFEDRGRTSDPMPDDWITVQESDDWATDTVYTIETLVYSLEEDKLIWAGRSETVNPVDLEAFVSDYASVVDDELRKSGLLE